MKNSGQPTKSCALGMAPQALSDLEPFDDAQELGKGATASVKLVANNQVPPQRYALKVVDKARIVGQSQVTRLFREKELLGELHHASIVDFHATFKDEGHLYFLLELLPGGELLWHMRRNKRSRVPTADARLTLAALLLPLKHMLTLGVLYRDLKPTNILFTASGRLKLVDFGHAKKVAGPLDDERSMSVCGTPHYHSPEAVRGDGHGLPAQLWALGVLLVEMVSGRPPFWEGGDLPPLNEQILRADPDWIPVADEARPLAERLLTADPVARRAAFGAGAGAANAYAGVMAHPWLESLDWDAIEQGRLVPSFDFSGHAAQLLGHGEEDDEPAGARRAEEGPSALASAFADF